jgi:rare lipoprotein A
MMRAFLLLAGLLMLAACGKGGPSPYGGTKGPVGVKLGKPYTVMGQYYEPRYDPNYREEGIASWYGPGFHGRMTASGEEFSTYEMTCAHRTLPMPSLVKVENLKNGKTAILRVNDRGPFAKNRIIDLSSAAADHLGVKATGTAPVRVSYLKEETEQYIADLGLPLPEWMKGGSATGTQYAYRENPYTQQRIRFEESSEAAPVMPVSITSQDIPAPTSFPSPAFSKAPTPTLDVTYSNQLALKGKDTVADSLSPPVTAPPVIRTAYTPVNAAASGSQGGYSVQTASFSTRQNAESHVQKLASIGRAFVREVMVNGQQFFRVTLGPVATSDQAQQMLEQARALGFTDARILVN